jgi:hypothetical protein
MSTDRSQLSRTNLSIVFRRLTTRRQIKEASATASASSKRAEHGCLKRVLRVGSLKAFRTTAAFVEPEDILHLTGSALDVIKARRN